MCGRHLYNTKRYTIVKWFKANRLYRFDFDNAYDNTDGLGSFSHRTLTLWTQQKNELLLYTIGEIRTFCTATHGTLQSWKLREKIFQKNQKKNENCKCSSKIVKYM